MSETVESSSCLCVDLDGTLLRSDTLYESFLLLFKKNVLSALMALAWILKGRAQFKRALAEAVLPEVATLPLDERVLRVIHDESYEKRVLVTAADSAVAQAVAARLGVFDEVIASDGLTNLGGRAKASVLVAKYGDRGFDYIGNSPTDLHVWKHARRAWVVNAPASLARRAANITHVVAHWPSLAVRSHAWTRAIRIHQWLKNVLVFLPLLAAHLLLDGSSLLKSAMAFLAFGLCASSVYILNDLLDLDSDRQHPRKRMRPFAAGDIPVLHGMLVAPLLLSLGFAVAWLVNVPFFIALATYWLITLAYSLWLKRIAMLDVTTLAALYTSRIVAGAIAIGVTLSFWMLALSLFLFFSLAMLKRLVEIQTLVTRGHESMPGRAYLATDLPLLQALGAASGVMAVLVLALYIDSPESIQLYARAGMLWLLCPAFLFWISRIWLLASRGKVHDDPVVFALTDKVSIFVAILAACILLLAI